MKKLLLGLLIGLGLTAGITYAAPGVNIFKNIQPETNTTYDLGSSTPAKLWNNVFTNNLLVNSQAGTGGCAYFDASGYLIGGAACSSGGGGGGGGGWATSSPNIISTNWLSTTNALVGINSSTPWAVLTVKGISGTTTPTFVVASSNNASLLRVASNGSTTLSSLGTGPIYGSSGSLYTNGTTGTGLTVQATSPTLVTPILGVASGTALTLSNNLWVTGTVSVTGTSTLATTSIPALSNLTSNGFVKTSGGTGLLSIDTATYLTGNQTITLSGDVSGSGTTGITTTIGNDKVTEAMLKVVDTPADEEILTYESTTGDFEWQTPAQTNIPNFTYASSAYFTLWNTQAGSNITITTTTNPTIAVSSTPTFTTLTTTGNTAVQGALTVTGTTTLSSATTTINGLTYYWPSSVSGTKILQNDGSGNLSWVADQTGGGGSVSGGIKGYITTWASSTGLTTGIGLDNGTVAGFNATSSTVTLNVQGSGTLNPFNVASSSGTSLFQVTARGNVNIATLTAGSILISDANKNVANSSLSQSNGTTLINGVTPIINAGGIWISDIVQSSGANFIAQSPTSTAVLGNTVLGGGVQYIQTTKYLSSTEFCTGGLFNVSSSTALNIYLPTLAQLGLGLSPTNCTNSIYAGNWSPNFVVNSGSNTVTTNASGTGQTLLFAPGSGATIQPGQAWFNAGQFTATSTLLGATTTGMSLNAYFSTFQPRATNPTMQGQFLMASSTTSGGNPEWVVGNIVAGANITVSTSTAGQIVITGSAGGSGNSAWTIGNGLIYNATSTDLIGIGTSTPAYKLSIVGTAGNGNILNIASSTGTSVFRVFDGTQNYYPAMAGYAVAGAPWVYLNAGAAGTPTYTFNGNQTTGMYLPATNSIGFSTAGVGRMAIDANGIVGIGTLTPTTTQSALLHLDNASFARIMVTASTSPNQVVGFFDARADTISRWQMGTKSNHPMVFLTNDIARLGIWASGGLAYGSTYSFTNDPGANTAIFEGAVGIGTTTPAYKLTVVGTAGNNPVLNIASSSGATMLSIGANGSTTISSLTAGIVRATSAGSLYSDNGTYPTGSGATSKIAYWNSASNLTSNTNLSYNGSLFAFNTTLDSAVDFKVQGGSGGAASIFSVTSSSGTSLLSVAANGSTTISSLASAGCVAATASGSLYITTCGGGSVSGTGTNGYTSRWSSASALTTGVLIDNGTVAGVNATSSAISFNVQGSTTLDPFNVSSSSGTSYLRVTRAGNIGVGTTTPTSNLMIQGTAGQTASLLTISSSTGSTLLDVAPSPFSILSIGYGTTTVTSANAEAVLQVKGNSASTTLPLLKVATSSGATYLGVGANGQVTLNTVAYTFPSSQGSASTTLVNNGSGVLTWQTVASQMTYSSGVNSTSTSGTMTIAHGLGRTPKMVRITAIGAGGTCGQNMSIGTYNGSATNTVYRNIDGACGTADGATDTSNIVHMQNGSSPTATATITIDGTNITLTWSFSSYTDTVAIMWEAY